MLSLTLSTGALGTRQGRFRTGGPSALGDADVGDEGLHGDAELYVVAVDSGPRGRFAAVAGATDTGQDWGDDVLAKGDEGGDGDLFLSSR
jgi:hypothetical protein